MIAELVTGCIRSRTLEACRVEEYRVVDRQFGVPASPDRRKEGKANRNRNRKREEGRGKREEGRGKRNLTGT
ncbi:hypothetical protein [Streptomyces anulatus]|uniref:hypothetical protein n=1 Tax=Streptomyces anulatus TaxID=1892 RepID=UPI003864F045|nr:hypothetical protein OG391_20640 [Streptomyces anulatus]